MASDSAKGQRDGETHLTPTSLTDTPAPEPGPPAHSDGGAEDNLNITEESAEWDQNGAKVCQFFRMKKCRFGDKCRLSHSDPSLDDSGAASPDTDDKQDGEKMEKQKKKKGGGNKMMKPRYSEKREVNKKPRMRTADDVINRVLWDSSVNASEFVVGYVDRFLGVLERPFCDFNWDTNPCDCDYSSELALPRHRIQYFSYRGHRVWDRHTRTDRVFGSTGQSLAPPFGREEEIKEETNAGDQDHLETEEQPPAVSGQNASETEECTHIESTHLEEEKQNEMNIHTPDSKQPAPECGGNTCQEQHESQGPCVAEEAANRCQASTHSQKEAMGAKDEGEEETLAEIEESWEGNEASESSQGAPQICQNPSAPPEPSPSEPLERREEKPGGRPPKKRPTHFITFRTNTPAILSSFQQLQKEITTLLPSSVPHWKTASRLHVTMCLLVLRNPAEVAAAVEILRQFAYLDRNPPVVVTFPVKLKHFGGKVLYLSPQSQLPLQHLNSGLQEAYRKEGLLHRDSYNPRYHLTLAKVKDREGERIFEGVGDLKVGKGINFGRLPVNTLHLCVINDCQIDGFYEIICTVTLR